jgi:diguanylate cyclase (GGDEF)-like protein
MTVKSKKNFRLTRAFSIVSLLGIITVAIIMTQIHRSVSFDSLLKVQNEANLDLTRAFSNSIWKKYASFFDRSSDIPKHEIIKQPEVAELENDLKRQMRGVRVVKIKVYNKNGLTVFSTDPNQIGEDKSKNQGFIGALNGEVKNEISFRDKFDAFDMVIEDRNLLSSYIPVYYGPKNEIVAVFELYSDITTLLEEINESELKTVALGSILMLVLYAFLLVYVRRADLVIKKHENEERLLQEERIKYVSENDQLTGLPNRNSLIIQIDKLFERSHLKNSTVTLFYIDIHRFKLINDSLGEDIGDQVLLEVVARLSETVRNTSIIGRAGPDEFLLAIENVGERVIDSILIRLIRALTDPYTIESAVANLAFSVGVVNYPRDATDASTALKNGEAAVLRSKELGKNRFAYFTNDLNKRAVERFELENALSLALEKEQFEVFFQPRVDTNGKTVSAEALIRWRRDDGQLISPALFINVLEDTELIVPVGYWVLVNACKECIKWHNQGFTHMKISVNLSMKQFLNGSIIEDIRKALLESGLEAEFLELELTESLFAENPDEALSILKAIKAFGIHISLDDFGTGYSSLSYLRKFPIDCLKIDKSFVKDISTNQDQANLTQSIINMAKALDMNTVAEGVEEVEQLDCLVELGSNELQGFFFSRPLSAPDFMSYLKSH